VAFVVIGFLTEVPVESTFGWLPTVVMTTPVVYDFV